LIEIIYPCHPERCPWDPELAKGTKGESKDPENVSSAMPRQGILPKLLLFVFMEKK
jgi:hypothetical protein